MQCSGMIRYDFSNKSLASFLVHYFRNVDDIHNLMDDVAEQQEIANEISDAISNPVGFGQDVDEVSIKCPCPMLIGVNEKINALYVMCLSVCRLETSGKLTVQCI